MALLVILAACGGSGTKTVTVTGTSSTSTSTSTTSTTPASTTPGAQMSLRVYFLLDGKVQPALRTVPKTKAVANAALTALLAGPTAEEKHLGLTTEVPAGTSLSVDKSGDVLTVHGDVPDGAPLAQVVYTLTQFPGAQTVELGGKKYTRGSFEELTPAILVELPLPFEQVTSPLRLAGSANTFEATFQYELKDASGRVVAKHFVTATSGNGVRGTYDVTIPFRVTQSGDGTLTVYENSAANGKRINQVSIPLTLER